MAAPPRGVVSMASSGEVATKSVVGRVGSGKATSGANGGVTMTAITEGSAFRGDNLPVVVVESDLRDVVVDFLDVVFDVDFVDVGFFDVVLDVLDDDFDGVGDVLGAGLDDDVDVFFGWVADVELGRADDAGFGCVVGGIVEGGVEIGGCVDGVKAFNK